MDINDTHNGTNGFREHRRLIIYRLEALEKSGKDIENKIDKLEKHVIQSKATIRVSTAIIGSLAGLIPTLLAIFFSGKL
jgi:hypothetical protein